MARDYISIGSSPYDEPCVAVGEDNYYLIARTECLRFIEVIKAKLGPEPGTARLKIKSNPHDFGAYLEVVCEYSDLDEEAMEYAFLCESHSPSTWDDIKPIGIVNGLQSPS